MTGNTYNTPTPLPGYRAPRYRQIGGLPQMGIYRVEQYDDAVLEYKPYCYRVYRDAKAHDVSWEDLCEMFPQYIRELERWVK